MINRIIEFSAKNRFIVFLLVAAAGIMGWWSMRQVPLDAIPDLSDTQVIIYSRWDRSPDIVEDQVTYPIVNGHAGRAQGQGRARLLRLRLLLRLRHLRGRDRHLLGPLADPGVSLRGAAAPPRRACKTELGPDATGLGWVFQYALVDTSGKHSLADLRSYQDWYLRYYLKAVPGVAEVAPIGGFTRQYQVNVDPNRLQAYGIPINRVVEAVRGGNSDVGGRLIEFGGTEYMVRGRGYAKSLQDLENIVLTASESGTPIRIKDIGQVALGPDIRRGVSDLDGTGEVVSGIVVMRQGENALDVIERVKAKIKEIEPGLPPGVKIVPVYDRSDLIQRSIDNLKSTLIEVIVTVALVILLFLWHIPSAIIPIITIPVAVLISFIPFRLMGVTANIMSLGGIAIAIGAMVDAAIVVVEQTHKKLEEWERGATSRGLPVGHHPGRKEVGGPELLRPAGHRRRLPARADPGGAGGPPLQAAGLHQDPRHDRGRGPGHHAGPGPAAAVHATSTTSTSAPAGCAGPPTRVLVGTIHPEERHPVSRVLIRLYEPVARWALRWKWVVIGGACALVVVTVPVYQQLGSEFMPPLDEGALFYMPSTMPGISVGEAQKLLQVTDRIIKQFPEVDRVLGKAGRAETSTDPAPLSMLETVIILKPKAEWRQGGHLVLVLGAGVGQGGLPAHHAGPHLHRGTGRAEMNAALQIPGVSNAWTMPIKARIDMLTTGIRTPVGLKISGADLKADRGDRAPRSRRSCRRCRAPAASSPSGPAAATSWTSTGTARSWPATA